MKTTYSEGRTLKGKKFYLLLSYRFFGRKVITKVLGKYNTFKQLKDAEKKLNK